MPQFNRVLVIVNPVAGQRNAAKIRSAIEAYFGEKGYSYVLRECKNPEDARDWARAAPEDGFDLVAACGGDGTIREAAGGIMKSRSRIPLAQIPAGTTNFVARAMLIPMNIRAALDVIDTGKPMPFDIGYIPEYDAYFVFVAGAGYDATLIRETPFHLKKKIGFAAYVATGIKHASAVQPVRMDLELDGKVRHLRAHTVMAVNIGTISNVGFSFAPDVDPHDGKLNIEIMSTRSLAGSLFIVLKILIKRYHGFAALKHEKASRIRVTSDPPFPVEIDGDHIGTTPFSAEVIPGGMTFLVPQNYTKDTYKYAMDPLAPLVADFKAEVDARLRGTRQKNG